MNEYSCVEMIGEYLQGLFPHLESIKVKEGEQSDQQGKRKKKDATKNQKRLVQ